jgi:hypothetical protein
VLASRMQILESLQGRNWVQELVVKELRYETAISDSTVAMVDVVVVEGMRSAEQVPEQGREREQVLAGEEE